MKDFQSFQELLVAGWNYIKGVYKFNELHIVFDSYIAGSLKECERERRSTREPYVVIVYLQALKFPHDQKNFGLVVNIKKSCKD